MKAELFDSPLFQQQIPEPKQNSVLFSIVCSKYRNLADLDSLFLRTFTDKRIQLVDAFNRQLRLYLEHKDNVENLKAKIPKVPSHPHPYTLHAPIHFSSRFL